MDYEASWRGDGPDLAYPTFEGSHADDALRIECRLRRRDTRPGTWVKPPGAWVRSLAGAQHVIWYGVIPLVYVMLGLTLYRSLGARPSSLVLLGLIAVFGGTSYSTGACCASLMLLAPPLAPGMVLGLFVALGATILRAPTRWVVVSITLFVAYSILGWHTFRFSYVLHTYSTYVLELLFGVFIAIDARARTHALRPDATL